jgi:tripartite ATP-independent transporter DctM subunit
VGFRIGVFTATEIAAVACAYSLFVGLFVYRTLSWKGLPAILLTTGRETAAILVIAAGAAPFGWILGVEQAPQQVAELLTSISKEPWVILLILNIALLVAGMFMETLAIMIILVPILIPLLNELQINLVHFGIVLLVNLVIGQITPPVGVLMFVASSVSKTHLGLIVKEIGPFVLALIGALMLLTYVPQLSIWLPQYLKS